MLTRGFASSSHASGPAEIEDLLCCLELSIGDTDTCHAEMAAVHQLATEATEVRPITGPMLSCMHQRVHVKQFCRVLLQAPFHCAICMEAVPGTACFVLQPCQHRFCRDCLLQHLNIQVASRTFPIRYARCLTTLLIATYCGLHLGSSGFFLQ